MTDPILAPRDPPPMSAEEPLGVWVTVPDGRIGHVWARHPDGRRFWVAFGTEYSAFTLDELEPAEGTFSPNNEQDGLPL